MSSFYLKRYNFLEDFFFTLRGKDWNCECGRMPRELRSNGGESRSSGKPGFCAAKSRPKNSKKNNGDKMFRTKKFFFALLSLLCSANFLVFSNAYISTQSHEGKVNFIEASPMAKSSQFFSAGNDGFIVKWGEDGMGEHYQISDKELRIVCQNPVTQDIAVYDTDGISTHRIVVIDSQTFERKFSKRFSDSITSLSFSARGNYLIVGTATVNGIYVLNARTGSVAKKAGDNAGIISLAQTSDSEKTAIMYSPAGTIVYYDLQTMKQKAKFSTESRLEQVSFFGNGKIKQRFLAGVKNNTIYLIDATSGKIAGTYAVRSPLIFSSKKDADGRQGLYFTTYDGKSYSLRYISEDMLIKQLSASTKEIFNPSEPLLLKYFTGLKSRDSFTCAAKNGGNIILGTQSGNIYTMTDIPESETYSLFPITEKMYEKIYDLDCDENGFYLLTRDSIYKTSYESGTITTLGKNSAHTNITKYENQAILWTKNSRRAVQLINLENNGAESKTLFSPANELRNLRIFGDKIVYILGTSSVNVYDFASGLSSEIYSGMSIQDAVLIDENTLFVAKTGTGVNDSPLISVNINTKETVPMRFTGNVAFSLSYDYDGENKMLYGINIKNSNNSFTTELFSYNPLTKIYTAILRLNDQDSDAFTYLNSPVIYTNLGKNQIYACNSASKKNFVYKRSASLPVKTKCVGNTVAILNHNGSISWYNTNSQISLGDWYLQVSGEWFEFR